MYLFVLDEDGRRITSLATGVHGDTVEELQARAAKDYPTAKTLIGGDEEQAAFMSGKAWDGKAFYTPAPVIDIEAMRQALMAKVLQWTEERIVGGFVSNGVRYDSDLDTQITMYGIRASVDLPRFKEEYPQGAPVRGYDKGATEKTVQWLDADAVRAFCADLSDHIGACKQTGWKLQKAVKEAQTEEELEAIVWPQEE